MVLLSVNLSLIKWVLTENYLLLLFDTINRLLKTLFYCKFTTIYFYMVYKNIFYFISIPHINKIFLEISKLNQDFDAFIP